FCAAWGLLVCLVVLGLGLAPQGVGVAEGDDVDGLHHFVPHPELDVGLDGVAAARVRHPLLGAAAGQGVLSQHADDHPAVGDAGRFGDVHPDHILEQLEQRLAAAAVEIRRGLGPFGGEAGAGVIHREKSGSLTSSFTGRPSNTPKWASRRSWTVNWWAAPGKRMFAVSTARSSGEEKTVST